MDSRRRLYKNTGNALTLTERVKKDRTRQNDTRKNKFNANRNIHVDLNDSLNTPPKPAPVKISQIKDKPAKLKAYIEQKRTNKLKETLEQRSPFIPYVPVGRWVEKKEPVRKPKAFTISTPVRKALMNDGKILKKSTIKEIATTAKKEKFGASKKSKQQEPAKSRKKILAELNNVPKNKEEAPVEDKNDSIISLNDTFEIIPVDEPVVPAKIDRNEENLWDIEDPTKNLIDFRSPDLEVPQSSLALENKNKSPVAKKSPAIENKNDAEKPIRQNKKDLKEEPKKQTAKIVVPVKRPNRRENIIEKKITEKSQPKKEEIAKKPKVGKKTKDDAEMKQKIKSDAELKKKTKNDAEIKQKTKNVAEKKQKINSEFQDEDIQQVEVKAPAKPASYTFKFYKSSLDNQTAYISIQLKSFSSNLESFISKLSEDVQSTVHQTIQQGNLLINEKAKNFEEFLEKFENADPNDAKRVTEEDIENYWMLLYEQVEKFKENLQYIQEAKTFVMKDEKKRRTRKTLSETPSRRSRRIAETGDTPKHNASTCFGCTPMSASKMNTPKSAKKRRTNFKKSIAFDLTSDIRD